MKKAEMADMIALFTIFIQNMYKEAGLPLPEDGVEWDPDEETMIVRNAMVHNARRKMAADLMALDQKEEERAALVKHFDSMGFPCG